MNTNDSHINYVRPAGQEAEGGDLAESHPMVEHLTVTEFMSRVPNPNRWHLDDINRFGDKVGWTANSIQLARMMIQSPSLGLIRVFPVPLLTRIYQVISPQFNWPPLPDRLPPARRTVQASADAGQRVTIALQGAMAVAQDDAVRDLIGELLQAIGTKTSPVRPAQA